MGYKWKPSAAQKKKEYAERMRESEKFDFIKAKGPLREGCYVEYVDKSTNKIIKGEIVTSSYGSDKGQHTFNVDGKLVKGRNIYDRLLVHTPGDVSKEWGKL